MSGGLGRESRTWAVQEEAGEVSGCGMATSRRVGRWGSTPEGPGRPTGMAERHELDAQDSGTGAG